MRSTQPAPSLVGREPALAAVRSGFHEAAAGRGHLLLVVGEPGIGKTALVSALAADAVESGALVLWGQCWEGDGAPGYWPWAQVLRAGIAVGGQAGEAAWLLPEAADGAPPATNGPADVRFRLFDAVASFLAGLAVERPVLVVLDDLQWADDASVKLLEFCARHLQFSPVLLVGTYREDEATAVIRQVAAVSRLVPLGGLVAGEVAELFGVVAGVRPAPDLAEAVWRRTGGNPLFVGELARLLAATGDLAGAGQQALVPESVREVIERRLARLSQRCTTMLAVAAVCGTDLDAALLRALVDRPDVGELLNEALAARVLTRSRRDERAFQFVHGLVRDVVLAGLPGHARRAIHRRAAEALDAFAVAGRQVQPAELAAHWCAAAGNGDPEAVARAIQASGEAARDAETRLAFEEAGAHYERALSALDQATAPDPTARLEFLLRLAQVRNQAGEAAGAFAGYRDAAELSRRLGDPAGIARAAIGVHALGWRVSHADSIALLEEAARTLPENAVELRARVGASLARDLHHSTDERMDWDRALVLAEQAVSIARELDHPSALAYCLLALHDASWRQGTAAARVPVIDEMVAVSSATGDRDMETQARLLRATALIELGDPKGVAELERYCRASDDLGYARARYGATSRRATLALLAGQLADAVGLAEQALELGNRIGEPDAFGVYETLLWAVRRVGGTWHTIGFDSDPWPGLPIAPAMLSMASGDLDSARRWLTRLSLHELPRTHDLEMFAFVSELVAAAGTAEQQEELSRTLRPYRGSHIVVGGCASYFGAVDHYLGLLERSLGRMDEAYRHFETAAGLEDRLGAAAWAGLSRREAAACATPNAVPATAQSEGVFRREGKVWTITYQGRRIHLPDAKGLSDLAVLLANPGQSIHAYQLHTGRTPQGGTDAVLDERAKAAYRARLGELDSDIDQAVADNDIYRAERATAERDVLIAELSSAVGLGGRDRRLGDERERARKAVSARIREAIGRIHRSHPELGEHLLASVRTGTWCAYAPAEPVRWRNR